MVGYYTQRRALSLWLTLNGIIRDYRLMTQAVRIPSRDLQVIRGEYFREIREYCIRARDEREIKDSRPRAHARRSPAVVAFLIRRINKERGDGYSDIQYIFRSYNAPLNLQWRVRCIVHEGFRGVPASP